MFALARCLLQVMLVYNRGKQCKHCCCKNVCLEWGLMTHQAETCFDKTGLFTKNSIHLLCSINADVWYVYYAPLESVML